MKILHVISDRNIGGAGILLCNLLRHLDRDRFSCIVALPEYSNLRHRIVDLSVPVTELKFPCDRPSAASVTELMKIIRREHPDIVHAHGAVCARIAGKLCGIRVIHTRHCCFPPEDTFQVGFLSPVGKFFNRLLSDRVIATADAAAINLIQLGIPKKKIEVIINGSDRIRDVSDEEATSFRQQFHIAPDDICIGCCARLEPCKGQETLLEAAQILLREFSDQSLLFLFAGDGSEKKNLERYAVDLGIAERVRFTGFLADTAPFYHLLSINVNTSVGTETSCLALSEGMSIGLPTVASRYGGNPAMLDHGNAGILFPPKDSTALAAALRSLLTDPILYANMKKAALSQFENHLTAEKMTKKTEQVYLFLLGK